MFALKTWVSAVLLCGGLLSHNAAASEPAPWTLEDVVGRAHFDKRTGAVFISVKISGSIPYTFLVDTGCSNTMLGKHLGHLAGKKIGDISVNTPLGKVREELRELPEIQLNQGVTLSLKDVIITDTSDESKVLGTRIDGILGYDVLQSFVVDLDSDRATVTLARRLSGIPPGDLVSIANKKGVPYIPVSIGHAKIRPMRLDTGCFGSINLGSDDSVELAKSGAIQPTVSDSFVSDMNGNRVKAPMGRCNVSIGQNIIPDIVWRGRGTFSTVGLYLVERSHLVLDGPNQSLYWSKGQKWDMPDHSDMDGLLFHEGVPLRVQSVQQGSLASKAGICVDDTILSADDTLLESLPWLAVMHQFALCRKADLQLRIVRRGQEMSTVLPR